MNVKHLVLGLFIFFVFLGFVFGISGSSNKDEAAPEFDPLQWVRENVWFVINYIAKNVLGLKTFIEYVWTHYIWTPLRNTINWAISTVTNAIGRGFKLITIGFDKFIEGMKNWAQTLSRGMVEMAEGFIRWLRDIFGLEVVAHVE
jgi:hypothetical protein